MYFIVSGLFDENGVDNSVLSGSGDDLCPAEFGLDDCALCKEVTADVVLVCGVLFHIEDGGLLGLACLRVGNVCGRCTECTDLGVAAVCADDLLAVFADVCLCRCTSDFDASLAACRL